MVEGKLDRQALLLNLAVQRQQLPQRRDHPDVGVRARQRAAAEGEDLHPEGEGPVGHGLADPAHADEPDSPPGQPAELGERPVLRLLVDPHVGDALLEGQHGGQDELGDGDGARSPRTGQQRGRKGGLRQAVHAGPEVVDPLHTAHELLQIGAEHRDGEEGVARDGGVDLALERDLHDVEVRVRSADPLGAARNSVAP